MSKPQHPPRSRIFVGGLLYSVSRRDLQQFFSAAGPVVEVFLAVDREDASRNRGFGFVQFPDADTAQKALEMFNNEPGPGGRRIGIKIANED